MKKKRLFEVRILAYALAETLEEAARVVFEEWDFDEVTVEGGEAWSVESAWWDAFPYGNMDEGEDLTCGEILSARLSLIEAAFPEGEPM